MRFQQLNLVNQTWSKFGQLDSVEIFGPHDSVKIFGPQDLVEIRPTGFGQPGLWLKLVRQSSWLTLTFYEITWSQNYGRA